MSVNDLLLEDIAGIGPTTAKKLKDASILSVVDLAVCSANELAETINCSKDTAATMIQQAIKLLTDSRFMDPQVSTAKEALEQRAKISKLKTGSKDLDDLLKGGIETQSITEFYAEFGSGKTQVCHTLAVLATLPLEEGGLNASTLYIDTENTFRPERLKEIAEARELDTESIMSKIIHIKAFNSSQFEFLMNKDIGRHIERFKPKLIIVDGILSQHRADFMGRGTLADRQQHLHQILSKLKRSCEVHDIAVVVTNQVHASPDSMFIMGDGIKASGGHVVAHSTTYRLYLRKGQKTTRVAKMIDSPYHALGEARFKLSEKGIEDLE